MRLLSTPHAGERSALGPFPALQTFLQVFLPKKQGESLQELHSPSERTLHCSKEHWMWPLRHWHIALRITPPHRVLIHAELPADVLISSHRSPDYMIWHKKSSPVLRRWLQHCSIPRLIPLPARAVWPFALWHCGCCWRNRIQNGWHWD